MSKGCDECEGEEAVTGSLKDSVWNTLVQQRKIIINSNINEDLIEKAVIQIYQINEYDDQQDALLKNYIREPIEVFINTSGGFLDEAFSLISAIMTSKAPVHTVCLGKAWSAGFLILLAGHVRFAQPFSSMMFHQGSAGIQGEFSKAIEYAKYWEKTQKRVDQYVLSRTKIKKKKLKKVFDHSTDWYMTTDEALHLGIVDGVYGADGASYTEGEEECK